MKLHLDGGWQKSLETVGNTIMAAAILGLLYHAKHTHPVTIVEPHSLIMLRHQNNMVRFSKK